MTRSTSPTLLCILDGWGHRSENTHNAIAGAVTPHWDRLIDNCAHTTIDASAEQVGLPPKQMGNSEVGHMNIGGGRPPRQLLPRINEAIKHGTLGDNEALQAMLSDITTSGGAIHLTGLCSDGGVHAHITHIITLAHIIADAGITVWLHCITDGRDTPPQSARDNDYIEQLVQCAAHPLIHIATISGRFYAMDRDHNWDRVQRAYDAMAQAIGFEAPDALSALAQAYERGESDEFIQPTVLGDYEGIKPEDGILMANFRPDRARQLMQAYTQETFDGFARAIPPLRALGMADYWSEDCPLDIPAIFPMEKLDDTLGSILSNAGKTQLRIAETEKFNHVTFFFSGSNGKFAGEDRIMVPSPSVETYDLQPEMSAPELTQKLTHAIKSGTYDFIVVNYANPDMVGHTGNYDAAVKAIEAVDACLGQLIDAIDESGGVMLVTADHGNVEQMEDAKGNPHTQHTVNPVPFVVYGRHVTLREQGTLADIAPTILQLMDLPKPQAMTGTPLIISSHSTDAVA